MCRGHFHSAGDSHSSEESYTVGQASMPNLDVVSRAYSSDSPRTSYSSRESASYSSNNSENYS